MKTLALRLAIPAILGLSACESHESAPSAMKADPGAAMAPASSGYYVEERHDGRIYVYGTQAAHDNFEKSKQTPQVAKTFIGSGPAGETVVFEADSKSTDLQNRLRTEFNRRHGLNLQ